MIFFFQSAELNIAISILLQIIMSACTKSQRSNREKTRSNYASYILPRDNYWYIKCPIASHWHYVQPLLLWSVILFAPSVSGRRKQKIWIIQAHYKKNSTVEVSYYSNTQLYIGPIWNYSKSIKNWYKKCNCFCHFYSGNWIKSFCPRSSVWSSWSFGSLVKFKH